MSEDGVIKFECNWSRSEPVDKGLIKGINSWRDKMYQKGWLGVTSNGIGYGNLSIRLVGNIFLITGTATGSIQTLTNEHYTKVIAYNLEKNAVTCLGPVEASSESLSHAAIYRASPATNAIIHIHSKSLWQKLKNKETATAPGIEYGTPEMAKDIIRLFKETDVANKKIIIMAGHEDGLISFGSSLEEAGEILLRY